MVAIKPKINVLLALSALIARKAVLLFLVIDSVVLTLTFIGICLLAYFFSPWWWLLLVIYIPLFIASAVVYLTIAFIAARLYPAPLVRKHRQHLQEFINKLQRLLETRGISWWQFAAVCVRDLLFYRELRTLKGLLADTASLKGDFTELERELQSKT